MNKVEEKRGYEAFGIETFSRDQATPTKICDKCGAITERKSIGDHDLYHYPCHSCEEKQAEKTKTREEEDKENQRKLRMYEIIYSRSPEMFQDIPPVEFDEKLFDTYFLIFGDFGTGKTYTVHSLAQHMMRENIITDYVITRAFKMMMEIKGAFSTGTYEKVVANYEKLPFLVIDEWGKNSGTDFEEAVLFEIVNTRFENGMRTGIIINAKKKEDLLTLIRPDVLDRFRRGIVEINGKSKR